MMDGSIANTVQSQAREPCAPPPPTTSFTVDAHHTGY